MFKPNVQLLLTGNELMTGDIVDSNSAMIAQQFKELGLDISRKVTIADNLSALVNEINQLAKQADILIINGGLGPTIDDLTAQALAKATQVELAEHNEALVHITAWCKKRGAKLNSPNLKQAILPQGCAIIANKEGSAVGFKMIHLACDIYCTPGVPRELKTMLAEQIIPDIAKKLPKELITDVTRLQVFGLGESTLQKMIDEQLPNWPESIDLGFRAGMPLLEVKLTTTSQEGHNIKTEWYTKLVDVLGDHVIAKIEDTPLSLAKHILLELSDKNLKVTTAESCTGGMIASLLTKEAGASTCFEAGFVTYSNKMKTKLLGVTEKSLDHLGAVSKEVVIEMAKGALEISSADYVIAVSGIAGPDGGSIDKPVGTVWLAWGHKNNLKTVGLLMPLPRSYFQKYIANIGLDLIRRELMSSTQTPHYIVERKFS
ncbi:CinA family nicotinamide mononucleotide deamidase-related protein [Candidatus Colwellia aromaticivorans]|uniref:CinA family nicotinamide mononucleotide deamidase-related protein n=1 Tax=Candidatus Colwellia aromaticivorans TaxID=2267621 RepID=UPI000DF3F7DA|nr:CinA family nicotinamide mononucleotide deamidase-related protein [Candidatus Colwellia aromaticivorans]